VRDHRQISGPHGTAELHLGASTARNSRKPSRLSELQNGQGQYRPYKHAAPCQRRGCLPLSPGLTPQPVEMDPVLHHGIVDEHETHAFAALLWSFTRRAPFCSGIPRTIDYYPSWEPHGGKINDECSLSCDSVPLPAPRAVPGSSACRLVPRRIAYYLNKIVGIPKNRLLRRRFGVRRRRIFAQVSWCRPQGRCVAELSWVRFS
jgi:hypothetical protein